jgi:hypothetical protein
MAVPVTYWLEGMRRAINGGVLTYSAPGGDPGAIERPISPMLATLDNWQLLAILVVAAVAASIVSVLFYGWVEHQAKERGMIDRITGY